MRTNAPALILLGSLLSACTTIPPYERPELPVPDSFTGPAAESPTGAVPAAELPWRDYFKDERLQAVIELALAHNRDLRVAMLNVERAQAYFRVQRSELSPGVGAMATGDVTRIPAKVASDGTAYTAKQYSVQLGIAAWEIDFFGRLKSLKAQALEQYLASAESADAAADSLVAAVAASWLTLAADSEQAALARATLEAQQRSLELVQGSHENGMASAVDVAQVRTQVEAARAALATYTGLVATDRSTLELLAGGSVSEGLLPERLASVTDVPDLKAGIPSEVLLRRPDIRAAEHTLRAANANVGVARAAFFPRISLTAGIGTASTQLGDLFGKGTGTWTFAPQITAPLFAGGGLRANLDAATTGREIAVAQYEGSIQAAFADVKDALALRATLASRRDAQGALVAALDDTLRLSTARYKAGVDGYLAVLVAQRALFEAQQALVGARLAELLNRVTLYKVLGGGT